MYTHWIVTNDSNLLLYALWSYMLGPYNTSAFPYYYCHCTPYFYSCAHVVHILLLLCPIEAHYRYCCALTLLLLCWL